MPGGIIVYFGIVFPTFDNFPIYIEPAICTNIMGINLCPVGISTFINPLYQSNISGLVGEGGKVSQINIINSTTFSIPPPQYYLIFGNI